MNDIIHQQVFQWMEEWAPRDYAYDWDPVGLQVGNYNEKTKNILVTLDVTSEVVAEAIENNANLIISHHPILFRAIQQIDTATSEGKLLQKLLKHNITVYSSHTNLDMASGGVNDVLANLLQLNNLQPLADLKYESLYKIIVYVPKSHAENVREALSLGGAGHIGNYSHCTFQTAGEGTFKPLEGTNPYIGESGKIEYVSEYKIESIVPKDQLTEAIDHMIKAHPYEEVAYDIIPLENKGKSIGLGRIGTLQTKQSLETFALFVKDVFQINQVKVTGQLQNIMERVAVIGGSGEKYIHVAKRQGADVLVTGDVTFHQAQAAEAIGLAVIDAGHYIEHLATHEMHQYLERKLASTDRTVYQSKINTNPFQYI